MSIWNPVTLGEHQDSYGRTNRLIVRLFATNWLMGGSPGKGKSVAVQVLIAHAARDLTCRLFLADPKVVELREWQPRCTNYWSGGDGYEALAIQAEEVLAILEESKLKALALGVRKLETSPVFWYLDEVADLLAKPLEKENQEAYFRFYNALRTVAQQGRAFGIVLVLATQKPDSKSIPSDIRDLLINRVAFSVTTREASETVLGSGSSTAFDHGDASKLPDNSPGNCIFRVQELDVPRYGKFRPDFTNDELLRSVAKKYADSYQRYIAQQDR